MSSVYSEHSSSTRTISRVVVDFFNSMRSGLKTPLGSPGRGGRKDKTDTSPKTPPKFQSFAPGNQNIRKIQTQKRSSRVLQAKKPQTQSLLENDENSVSHPSSECSHMTYDRMAEQRIGILGPVVDPYLLATIDPFSLRIIERTRPPPPPPTTSLGGQSMLTLDTQELSFGAEFNSKLAPQNLESFDIDMLVEASSCLCVPPGWPGKSFGFRALTAEHFKSSFKKLEIEVQRFQKDAREIQETLVPNCMRILEKQPETRDFLQYTNIYLLMLEPIANDIYSIEKFTNSVKDNLSMRKIEVLEEEYFDSKENFKSLPDFHSSMWKKRELAEFHLYELNQFCVQVSNHKSHDQKIISFFRKLEFKYCDYTYLLREYICQLWHHYELLRWGVKDTSWLKIFHRFESALKMSVKENYEAHDMMNQIESCRSKVRGSMHQIQDKIDHLKSSHTQNGTD